MRISARCDYACKAVLALALHWPGKKPLQMQIISEKHGIPLKYLPQILLQLKRMGIAKSIRGKNGGYVLARDPGEISLGELVREISGPLLPLAASAEKNGTGFSAVWKDVEHAMADVLDKVMFDDIVMRTRSAQDTIMYQI